MISMLDKELDQKILFSQFEEHHQNNSYLCFKLNEDDEIERLKQLNKSSDLSKCTQIDLYNVPQSSKPVVNFLERDLPQWLNSFSFNLEGKDIHIDKYVHSLFKRMTKINEGFSINFWEFDTATLKIFLDKGNSMLSNLKLLDLSYCQGLSIKTIATKIDVFKNLSSLIMHHWNIQSDETKYFKELFEKAQNIVYWDLRYNQIKLELFITYVCIVPELYYLFVKGNVIEGDYMYLLRKYEFTGLIDPWVP